MEKVDTTTKIAVGSLLVLIVSVVVFTCYPSMVRGTHWPMYGIQAHILENVPADFFLLDNPDSVVYRAISNPGEYFVVKQDETGIASLIETYGTCNIGVNGSFYQINVTYVDTAPPLHLAVIYPVSLAAMAAGIVVLITTGLAKFFRKICS